MTIVNTTGRLIVVTDIKIAGVSVLAQTRDAMLADGRLEDPDDQITIHPGDRLTFGDGVDTAEWIEE